MTRMRMVVLGTLVCASTALVLGAGYVGYLWATYLSEVTTSGEAYGLTIGDSKHQAYEKLPSAFRTLNPADPRVFMEITAEGSTAQALAVEPGKHVMAQTHLDAVGFAALASSNDWQFYVGASYHDSLTLTFCDERLCRIYRQRKRVELP